ncbi:MAG: amidohydrolase family protein [Phycisphaeraceae bacterium]
MIVDTHQHVFWHHRDDAGLIADMDDHGIDTAWLLTWEIAPEEDAPRYHRVLNPLHMRPDGTHAGITLGDLILTRDRYPDRFVLGYCPHPLRGDAPALFEAACHMHGVRVCGEWKFRVLFDDPRCLNLFRKAGALNCPVVLHLDAPYLPDAETGVPTYCPNWYGGTLDNLLRAVEACPETTFIGHAPGFWRYISGDAERSSENYPTGPIVEGGRLHEAFDNHPNLYADLSAGSALRALKRDADHAKAFLTRYADRLLFARDYYGTDLHQFLQSLDLPDDVREKIYFRNALKLVPDEASA